MKIVRMIEMIKGTVYSFWVCWGHGGSAGCSG